VSESNEVCRSESTRFVLATVLAQRIAKRSCVLEGETT